MKESMPLQFLWICPDCNKHEFIIINHECAVNPDLPSGQNNITRDIEILCSSCGKHISTINANSY